MPRDENQTAHELAVFGRFLEAHASLAADVACYIPAPNETSDMMVTWTAGSYTDFQLGEWLHEPQMAEAKPKETLRTKLREVLSQRIKESPRNIRMIALEVTGASFRPTDADAFATELWRMVSKVDGVWEQEHWRRQLHQLADFVDYATLGKYVRTILVYPSNSRTEMIIREAVDRAASDPEIPWERLAEEAKAPTADRELRATDSQHADSWIEFPLDGGAYSSDSALQALEKILNKKIEKYKNWKGGDFQLIIYYDKAVLYNTPYEDLRHETFADMAGEAARMLTGKDVAPFNRIYLLRALSPNPEAFEILPSFRKCG